MFWERIVVKKYERLLLSRNGRFDRILVPGAYRILVAPFVSLEEEKHNIGNRPEFRSKWADHLLSSRPGLVERHFMRVETTATQVAIVYLNEALYRVLVPCKRVLFWRDAASITVEFTEVVNDPEPPCELLELVHKVGRA